MKVPLRFQITEFDCGTVSLTNAFSYLFEREEIPAELIKAISTYTLDCYDVEGDLGEGGTSKEAVSFLTRWIVNYSKAKDFNINCVLLEKEEITIDKLKDCTQNSGVVFIRVQQEVEHYVIITEIKDEKVYIFDSYYLPENAFDNDSEVRIVLDKPFTHNRIVSLDRLFEDSNNDFAMGETNKRVCVLINKK